MITIIHTKTRAGLPYSTVPELERNTAATCYAIGWDKPNYPMPVRLVTFDYWPACKTSNGKPALFGQDHYKPGRWLEFLTIK